MASDDVAEPKTAKPVEPTPSKSVDDRLIDELVTRARAEGLKLTGEGGLLQQLTKRLLESALGGEITDHLGYDKHDPAGKDGGNARNARSPGLLSCLPGREALGLSDLHASD